MPELINTIFIQAYFQSLYLTKQRVYYKQLAVVCKKCLQEMEEVVIIILHKNVTRKVKSGRNFIHTIT